MGILFCILQHELQQSISVLSDAKYAGPLPFHIIHAAVQYILLSCLNGRFQSYRHQVLQRQVQNILNTKAAHRCRLGTAVLSQFQDDSTTFVTIFRGGCENAASREYLFPIPESLRGVIKIHNHSPFQIQSFLDEIFKCNDGVLNSLLTALNERKYTNEGRTYPIPTISFFAASNEIPNFTDPQEKILEALYDRLELKVVTENISDRAKRLAVLRDKQAGRAGQIAASFTLEELKEMQKEVSDIPVPDSVNELADDILCELRKSGIPVSDRKYLNYYPIVQAKAWLSGHAAVESTDLLALKNYLWQKPGDRAVVEATLERMCVNPMQDKVNSIRAMSLEALDSFEDAMENATKPSGGAKALQKLRGELVRLYAVQQELANTAQSDSERALADSLLEDLEQTNRQASQAVNFTCMPLRELAAMQ